MVFDKISPAQYLQLNRAKERRKRVILAHVLRDLGGEASVNSRIIKEAMSRDIKIRFKVRYIKLLPPDQFDVCLEYILTYRFHYLSKWYG